MENDAEVRTAIERNVKVVAMRDTVGRGTARTKAVLHPGLDCTVTEGAYELRVAMTQKYGGSGNGPNPGTLGRAALASCLAIGYGMWSARLGVTFNSVEVVVEADYDVRGELGVDAAVRPGYLQMRYIVSVESPAPEEDVRRVLDTADRFSPYKDIFGHGLPLVRELRLTAAT